MRAPAGARGPTIENRPDQAMTGSSIQPPTRPADQLVTVFGGSGFLGRHVVRALALRGYRVRVAVRRPDLALFLQPLGRLGQIAAVQANLRYPASVTHAVAGADVVVNLVGILESRGPQTFSRIQAEGAGTIAKAAGEAGARVVHVSAIGADPASASAYGRTKAEGEAAVLAAAPGSVILRPSLLFGPGDGFFNRFAALARALPVLPLAGAETRFQPVFVGDVAEAIVRAVDGAARPGAVYELGGPEVATLEHLVRYMLDVTHRSRPVLALPLPVAKLQARILETVDMLTLGLLPSELKLTRDQVVMLQSDNVVSVEAEADGRTLAGLGITPIAAEAVVPGYLWRFRKAGQFSTKRGGGEAASSQTESPADAVRRASGPSIGPNAAAPSRMGSRWGTRGS